MRDHPRPRKRDLLSFEDVPERLTRRAHQLAMLRDALSSACSGGAVTALVHGPKGAGKSALIRYFLREEGRLARVLTSALDDGSPFASLAPIAIAIAARPEAAPFRGALSLLFPEIGERAQAVEPSIEALREARAALRDAVAAVAKTEPLIVVVDDVAACDEDSRALLHALAAPGALLVLAYRSDDPLGSAPAKALIRKIARGTRAGDVREIVLLDVPGGDTLEHAKEPTKQGSSSGAEALARLAFHRAARALGAEVRRGEGDRSAWIHAAIEAGALADAAGAALGGDPPRRAEAALLSLRAGSIDAALAEAERAMGPSISVLPRSRLRAAASRIYQRARLSIRGLDVPPSALLDSDEMSAVGALVRALVAIDPHRASGLAAWLLRAAIERKERSAIIDALASSAVVRAAEGDDESLSAARDFAARAASIATSAIDKALVARAEIALLTASSSFEDATIAAENAESALAMERGPRARSILADLTDQRAHSLAVCGRLGDLAALVAESLDDAEEQGDLARVVKLSVMFSPLAALGDDLPHAARSSSLDHAGLEGLDAIADRLLVESPSLFASRVRAIALSFLYEGYGGAARAQVLELWPVLDERGALEEAMTRIDALTLRATTAIAAREMGARMEVYLETASRDAAAVAREGSPYAKAHALAIEALLATARGRRTDAADRFDDAERAFERMGMALHASACAYRRGEVMSSEEGMNLATAADQHLRRLGVREPAKMVFALLPV